MSILNRFAPTPLALALALALAGGPAAAASKTYTLDGDFDLGTLVGVNHANPNNNQLQLNVTGSSFPVLWIANAGEDTLSKVDSKQIGGSPGREIARYRTWFNSGAHAHDAWNGPAPSRTAVDKDGNAYVLDRWFGGYPTLFKILNNTYIDRNGNGVLDTSTDTSADGRIQTGEMKPLVDTNGNGVIDPGEIQDERIAWVRRVPDGVYGGGITRSNGIGRALCIGTDGNLWVGLYNNAEYYKVSAADGSTLAGPVPTGGQPNYGCLIDQNGTLWGANWDRGVLTRIGNTASNTGPYPLNTLSMPSAVYGLALRRDTSNLTHVIMGGSCNSYVEHIDNPGDPGNANWTRPAAVNYCTYAVGTDNDGNILVSKRDGGVVKFNPAGGVIYDKGSQVGSSDSRGVIADSDNNVWQVHRATHNMAKYAGPTGNFLGIIPVGFEPYTYSDASGTAVLSQTTKTGNWSVVQDGAAAGTPWGTVSWNANVPTGASVKVEARASDTTPSGAFTPVANGTPFGLAGRYLEVRVTLDANPQNQSPVVFDVTVASIAQARCDVDGDGDVDKLDTDAILRARGQAATAGDARDADGDGQITVRDAKLCIQKCTRPNCATQ